MKSPIISCRNVELKFKLYKYRSKTLKENLIWLLKKKTNNEQYFTALKNINFDLYSGDRLGIIGRNGSGKSTLLKTICKIYCPSQGDILIKEKITPLLEAGAGFQPECTGRENIYLNGAINCFSKAKMDKIFDDIVDFAELRNFIDVPVKYYSTGMYMRLAFSLATAIKPKILIIDELFVGGDYTFLQKGKKQINNLVDSAKALILVSHDQSLLGSLCNKFMWIEKGMIVKYGNKEVLNEYLKYY